MVSILLLYLNFPPCVPPYNGLRSTSLFNFPPCVPPYNGLHSISLFKLPPFLHSTIQWYPFYFFISISPSAFHHTIVSILMLYLNFPPCVPPYNGLHSTIGSQATTKGTQLLYVTGVGLQAHLVTCDPIFLCAFMVPNVETVNRITSDQCTQ